MEIIHSTRAKCFTLKISKRKSDFLRVVSGADETQKIKFVDTGQHNTLMSRCTKWFCRKCAIMFQLLHHLSSSPSQLSSSVYQVPLSFLIGLNQYSGDVSVFLVIKTRLGSPDDPCRGQIGFYQDTFSWEGLQSRNLKGALNADVENVTVPCRDPADVITFLTWFHQINLRHFIAFKRNTILHCSPTLLWPSQWIHLDTESHSD